MGALARPPSPHRSEALSRSRGAPRLCVAYEGPRSALESAEDALGGRLARSHAVRDPDTSVRAPGQMQARQRRGALLDCLDSARVPDVILRHRLGPPCDASEDGLGGDPQRLTQL